METMDDFIQAALRGSVATTTEPAALSDDQAARIEAFIKLGVDYTEARDLVLSATPPTPPPPETLGTGPDIHPRPPRAWMN